METSCCDLTDFEICKIKECVDSCNVILKKYSELLIEINKLIFIIGGLLSKKPILENASPLELQNVYNNLERILQDRLSPFLLIPSLFENIRFRTEFEEQVKVWLQFEQTFFNDMVLLDREDRISGNDLKALIKQHQKFELIRKARLKVDQGATNKRGEKLYGLHLDHESTIILSRIIRYFQNSVLYSHYERDSEQFCTHLDELHEELKGKDGKAKAPLVYVPSDLHCTKEMSPMEFSNYLRANQLSRKYFFKLRFKPLYFDAFINKTLDKKNAVIATSYLKLCINVACSGHGGLVHNFFSNLGKRSNLYAVSRRIFSDKTDVLEAGYSGLIDAMLSFESRYNFEFSTWADCKIFTEIRNYLKNGELISEPETVGNNNKPTEPVKIVLVDVHAHELEGNHTQSRSVELDYCQQEMVEKLFEIRDKVTNEISEFERQVFEMKFPRKLIDIGNKKIYCCSHDLSDRDISKCLNTSESTVQRAIKNVTAKLAEEFKKQGISRKDFAEIYNN